MAEAEINSTSSSMSKLSGWASSGSLWTFNMSTSCCLLEVASAFGPRFDLERFGVLLKSLPTEADLLILSGPITEAMRDEVVQVYRKMQEPKFVISMGSCANTGGMFAESPGVVPGVDAIVPVDLFIPGCPPRPEALIHGILRLQEHIRRERGL